MRIIQQAARAVLAIEAHPPHRSQSQHPRRQKLSNSLEASLPSTPGTSRAHGIEHYSRRQFPAGKHVYPDRDLPVAVKFVDPLVNPLIPPADQRNPLHLRKLPRNRLAKKAAPAPTAKPPFRPPPPALRHATPSFQSPATPTPPQAVPASAPSPRLRQKGGHLPSGAGHA